MPAPDTDLNLLFAVLALQADAISRTQFVDVCALWAGQKTRPLADLLVEQGWLDEAERATIEHLLRLKVRRFSGDVRASLAAAAEGQARDILSGVADPEVRQTLDHLASDAGRGSDSTVNYQPETRERYALTRLHAKGGIGQVWVARDTDLGREVALKEVRPDRNPDETGRARFLAEARITGQLEHPGIVPVYELVKPSSERKAFYTMRFVRGRTLRAAIRGYHQKRRSDEAGPLDLIGLLNAFVGVCNAVAYAHSRGVIHRDLKGENVVLGDFGEAMVLDWGLAKQLDTPDALAPPGIPEWEGEYAPTLQGQVLGTPAYMAPEQAAGRLDEVDRRSDVYGLGAMLYEILTGEPPFNGPDTLEVLRRVRDEAPARPRQVNPEAPAALEAVCLKALSKRPECRYASAGELARDVQHFLADEPVSAHRESVSVRAGRWARRHRPIVAGVAALLVTAVVALSISTVLIGREQAETRRQRDLTLRGLYDADINLAQRAWQGVEIPRVLELLEKHRPRSDREDDLRGFEWYYLLRLCDPAVRTFRGHRLGIEDVTFSPDSRLLASAGGSSSESPASPTGELKVWDVASGAESFHLDGHAGSVTGVSFSPDRRTLASSGGDGAVRLWDLATRRERRALRGHSGRVSDVQFSPDGGRLASAGDDHTVKVWDPRDGRAVATLLGHTDRVANLAFSPDGRILASSGWDTTVRTWETETGAPLLTLRGHENRVWGVDYSPDGRFLASVDNGAEVKVWDPRTGTPLRSLAGPRTGGKVVAFSPTGNSLAAARATRNRGGYQSDVEVWSPDTGRSLFPFRQQNASLRCLAFSPDGRLIASAGSDRSIKVWEVVMARQTPTFTGHGGGVTGVAFSPDGRLIASSGYDQKVILRDARTGLETRRLEGKGAAVLGVAFSPDGRLVASAGADGLITLWDPADGRATRTLRGHQGSVSGLAFRPDGRRLASAGWDESIHIREASDGRPGKNLKGHTGPVLCLAYSPDGRRLASAGRDRTIRVWDPDAGRVVRVIAAPPSGPAFPYVFGLAFSPDGASLAMAGSGGAVEVRDAVSGRLARTLVGHVGPVYAVAYSPEGRRLVSGGADKSVKVWDVTTGQELLDLIGHGDRVSSLAFRRDGRAIVSGSWDRSIKVWEAAGPEPTRPAGGPTAQ